MSSNPPPSPPHSPQKKSLLDASGTNNTNNTNNTTRAKNVTTATATSVITSLQNMVMNATTKATVDNSKNKNDKNNPRMQGLRKSKTSNRRKLLFFYNNNNKNKNSYDDDDDDDDSTTIRTRLNNTTTNGTVTSSTMTTTSGQTATTTTTKYEGRVTDVKFNAADFRHNSNNNNNNADGGGAAADGGRGDGRYYYSEFFKYYTLGKVLYRTDFCSVHLCKSKLTKRERVVKIVNETDDDDDDDVEKHTLPKTTTIKNKMGSVHEFEILKGMDHPNIPTVYELFRTNNNDNNNSEQQEFYIVMKYSAGGTLLNFLNSNSNNKKSPQPSAGTVATGTTMAGTSNHNKEALSTRNIKSDHKKSSSPLRDYQRTFHKNTTKSPPRSPVRSPEHRRRGDRSPPTTTAAGAAAAIARGGGLLLSKATSLQQIVRIDNTVTQIYDITKTTIFNNNNNDPTVRSIHKKSPLSEDDCKMIMLQLLSCVNYCHQNKIIHCDIKTSNIMLDYVDDLTSITLIDFDTAFRQSYEGEKIHTKRRAQSATLLDLVYLAPEVIQDEPSYDGKSDVWSCGIVLYQLLSNTLPFVKPGLETQEELVKAILSNQCVSFPQEHWEGISEEAKEYIEFLLTYDTWDRPTAALAVSKSWLYGARAKLSQVFDDPETSGAARVLHNLRKFNAADTKMKEAVCSFIATHLLTNEEIRTVDRLFQALDTQRDGKIRRYELKHAYYQVYNKFITESELDRIMKRIDLDGKNEIYYSEFSMAAVNKKDLLSKDRLQKAFKLFDVQGNGHITYDELRDAFRYVDLDMNYLNKLIKRVDIDGDGAVNFEEFVLMMKTK